LSRVDLGRTAAWQRKIHKHWRGSSVWYHLRLARGISVNVWTMKGLDHHVIEFSSVTERAPKKLADAKRSALRLVRALCLAGAKRAKLMLHEESRTQPRHGGVQAPSAGDPR